MFKLIKTNKNNFARLGRLTTKHGAVQTPCFMPVATIGAVKYLSAVDIQKLGFELLLSNTYHLMLRPGEKLVKKHHGLHKFINWPASILTDSGGYQVFSLGKNLVKLTATGVEFSSHIDGQKFFLTPEKVLQIQADLGVDIAVCLDECVALPATKKYLEQSVALTIDWAARTKKYLQKIKTAKPLVFAVVQGGLDKDLRLKCARELIDLNFDGYNIGGLSVGESPAEMYKVLDWLADELPQNKTRYLMGVGYPENIVTAVKAGIDLFDCVIPTREGRHGRLFIWQATTEAKIKKALAAPAKTMIKTDFYQKINITNAAFTTNQKSINPDSIFPELQNCSYAYLHHLFNIKEPLALRLASLNNLEFYARLMRVIRENI